MVKSIIASNSDTIGDTFGASQSVLEILLRGVSLSVSAITCLRGIGIVISDIFLTLC